MTPQDGQKVRAEVCTRNQTAEIYRWLRVPCSVTTGHMGC